MFCLLALDRRPEAQTAIEAIISSNPFYQPSEMLASPRIQAVFREVRRGLLPSIVQRSYSEAKAAFDRKDPGAPLQFERLLTLLQDPDLATQPGLTDLRTVAIGFRDLSKAAAAAAPPGTPAKPSPAGLEPSPPAAAGVSRPPTQPAPAAAAKAGQPAARPTPAVAGRVGQPPVPTAPPVADAGDITVTPPVVMSQPMPRWVPPRRSEGQQEFAGLLELLIDERGNVARATISKPIHPTYDSDLLKAARTWKYTPASRDGVPVSFLRVVQIRLRAAP